MQFLVAGILLSFCLNLAVAGLFHHQQPTSYSEITKHDSVRSYGSPGLNDKQDGNEYFSLPKYEFKYGVKDSNTGDIKDQWEQRDGDSVKGGYSMKEADGTTRIVEYTADDQHGFRAFVKRIGLAHKPVVPYYDREY